MPTAHRRGWLNIALGILVALVVTGPSARASAPVSAASRNDSPAQPSTCFLRRNWTGAWKVTPDSRTIYINVAGSVYRLDLDQAYPLLKSPWAVLHNTDASTAICTAIDFRLAVSDRTGNWQTPIVRKLTRLSAAQAAALPRNLRP
ncbi:MAG TPA: hypothetical protein VMD03_07685 [Steroidobacteraceae bacterium]|nr:hypothetical protein [Steroidobacteraceae bacterium]